MTNAENLQKIFDQCRKKWGLDSQIVMLAEEASELSVAALHVLREQKQNGALDHLAEEISDVLLMAAEIMYYFNLGPKMRMYREQKLARLRELLQDE